MKHSLFLGWRRISRKSAMSATPYSITNKNAGINFDPDRYGLKLTNDSGSYDKETKKWNGMVEILQKGQADFGITPSVDLESRRQVVDFTLPLLNMASYVAVFRSPNIRASDFAHLQPFQANLWLTIMAWIAAMTIGTLIVAHISVGEWRPTRVQFHEIGDWFLYALASICMQSFDVNLSLRNNSALNSLILITAAAAFTLNAAYSGILFSFLSLSQDTTNFFHLVTAEYEFVVTADIKFVLENRMKVNSTFKFI